MNLTSRHAPSPPVSSEPPVGGAGRWGLRPWGPTSTALPSRPVAGWPDAFVGLVLALLSYEELARVGWRPPLSIRWTLLLIALLVGAGVLFRRAPALGLTLAWLSVALQVVIGSGISLVVGVMILISFGAARYGRPVTLWAAALSVVLSAWFTVEHVSRMDGRWENVHYIARRVVATVAQSSATVPLVVLGSAAMLAPWGFGLVLRWRDQARTSQAETRRMVAERDEAQAQRSQAEELAELRERQARLARDVHDVVGHSLAVVLAQAESVQYLPDDDPAALRAAAASIATSARASLADVREVLSTMDGRPSAGPVPRGTLDTLIEDVRSAGTPLVDSTTGAGRPLPPELETTAYRVLQEMLTNALKHGRRGEPVVVAREWGENLTLTVSNAADGWPASAGDESSDARDAADSADRAEAESRAGTVGLGVEGIRRRLEHVGGTFTLTADPPHPATDQTVCVTASAVVPLSGTLRTNPPTHAVEDPA